MNRECTSIGGHGILQGFYGIVGFVNEKHNSFSGKGGGG